MSQVLPIVGYGLALIFPAYGAAITLASAVITGVVNAEEQRRAQRKALEAGRRDLMTMVRSAEEPHRLVYGTGRVSGPVAFAHTAGGNLYLAIMLTGHECAAAREIIFNEKSIGVTNGEVVPGSGYFGNSIVLRPYSGFTLSGLLQVALPVIGTLASITFVRLVPSTGFNPQNLNQYPNIAYTLSGNVVTVTEPGVTAGRVVIIEWYEYQGDALVDVKSYLGSPTQLADPTLISVSGGKWTNEHRLRGRAWLRVRLTWDAARFNAGAPNVSARMNGVINYDLRDASTSWSPNPARCIRDYLTNRNYGMRADVSEIDDASFITAANICDEFIVIDTATISPPSLAAKWQRALLEGITNDTWEQLGNSSARSFTDLTGLTLRNPGSMVIDTTTFPGRSALKVLTQSGAFSSYVQLDYLGDVLNGSVQITTKYPVPIGGVGICVRVTNRGSGDVFDGYRLQIDGTNVIRLFKVTAGALTQLGSTIGIVDPGGFADVTLRIVWDSANRFQCSYQGVVKIDVSDPVSPYTHGGIDLLAFSNPPGNPVYFFDVGTTDFGTATTFRQRRYTTNGVVTVDRAPSEILSKLLSSCAGTLSYTGGVYRLVVGAYYTPTLELTEDDLCGPVQILPRKPYRELFNAVRGIYQGRASLDQLTDFPAITNGTYETQDGGPLGPEQISTDIELAFTNDPIAAQRIALIHLERARRAKSITLPCKQKAIALRPGDTFMLTFPRYNFVQKVFRVEQWTLRADDDFHIDIVAQEEDSASYNWDYTKAMVGDTLLIPDNPQPRRLDRIARIYQAWYDEPAPRIQLGPRRM